MLASSEIVVESDLLEEFAELVVLLQPLINPPFADAPLLVLLESLADVFLQNEVEFLLDFRFTLFWRGQADRVIAARPGAVVIDGAPLGRDEMTGLFLVILHLEQNHRIVLILVYRCYGVSIEKLLRSNAQSILHSQDIVWRQEDVNVAAAFVEAGQAWAAGKLEGVFFRQAGVILQDGLLQVFNGAGVFIHAI